ncbi:MAG: 3-oxoacyl-(acyl-carrier-protein) synthase [Nitrospira sp.]|nr:MAG: 3-oxoacyl-(acyl-carrier-protein) synthase [Nitrospira sp.]
MRVGILGVGLLAAGLEGWPAGRDVLAGARPFDPSMVPDPAASLLPANERRRSSDCVRWAVQVAQEAIAQSGLDPHEVATVFASSGGEMDVLDKLCRALAAAERVVSPTLFHQSVHNTAAGYWGIATRCQQSSTALSCYDDSGAAGLLEAVTYAVIEQRPVLFVAYDLPAPAPLHGARPIASAFAAALVLAPSMEQTLAIADVTVKPAAGREVSRALGQEFERLRLDNPAARVLPVLQALATRRRATIDLNLLDDQRLTVEVEPCGR